MTAVDEEKLQREIYHPSDIPESILKHVHEGYSSVELHRSAKGAYYWTIKVQHQEPVRVMAVTDSLDQELRQKYGDAKNE